MAAFRSIAEKAYRAAFEGVPSLSKARIVSADSDNAVVSAVWEQHAVSLGEKVSYETAHKIVSTGDTHTVAPIGLPVPCKTPFLEASRNNVFVKIFKGSKVGSSTEEVCSLQVFKGGFLQKVLNLSDSDLHGPVYMDSELGCVALNSDASLVAYVAEAKKPKVKSFFSATSKKDSEEDDANIGQEFRFRDEWGEQMVGKAQSVIAIVNITVGTFKIVELKGLEGFCPGQLLFEGDYLVGTAVKTEPYKLGLVYCTNRPSVVFCVPFRSALEDDLPSECVILSANDGKVHARSPRADGNGNVIWTERNLDEHNTFPGPHQSAMRLMRRSLTAKGSSPVALIEVVKEADDSFAGLYDCCEIPERAFLGSGGRFLVSSVIVANCIYPMVCDVVEGKVQVLKDLPRLSVLDVVGDWVLGVRSDPTNPPNLAIVKMTDKGAPQHLQAITENALPETTDRPSWKSFSLLPTAQHPGEKIAFNAFYVGPSPTKEASVPLILFPHGGPHSVVASSFLSSVYFFNLLGYGVLIVNYRGSLGAGDASVASILGHVGTNDVSDCMQALDEAIGALPFLDPKAVVLFGGSHGGFLVTHLAGQHPDRFQAVVARNPVINIASMATVTDIPDWNMVESGQSFAYRSPDPEQLSAMFKKSPIAHVHKFSAPLMLMIGKNDLRVPPSQGLEMYRALKSLGKEVEMNVYDDCHPLAKVGNNINVFINSAMFYQKVLQK